MPDQQRTLMECTLAVLRKALWDEKNVFPTDFDWIAVYAELKNHTVFTLADSILMQADCAVEVKKQWSMGIIQQLNQNEQKCYAQNQLLKLINKAGIPVVILKGVVSAQYYPQPEKRALGDVDFLVPEERFFETLELLKLHGYVQTADIPEDECEVPLVKDGCIFELHRGVDSVSRACVAEINRRALAELHEPEIRKLSDYEVPILSDTTNGLILLTHIRHHLVNGLGLRQIIDWMMYVNRCLDDDEWNSRFQAIVRKCGLEKLAINVTRMCQLYLGLAESGNTWCKKADDVFCYDFMYYIFEGGNFGRKIEGYSHITQHVMMQKDYKWKVLTSLQSKGCRRDVVQKHQILRPIAWMVQLWHYVSKTLQRGNMVKVLKTDAEKARWLQSMLEELGVSRSE